MEEMKKNPVGRPRAFPNEKVLISKIQDYIDIWDKKGKPLTMAGLNAFLDVCEDTYLDYAQGQYDDDENNFSGAIKKARKFIEADKLERGLLGERNATMTIFDLKNNHGYSDKVQQDNTSSDGSLRPSVITIEHVSSKGK